MLISQNAKKSEAVRDRFIGRKDALSKFSAILTTQQPHNGIYYYGHGGTGKTWILKKILLDYAAEPSIFVSDIIDFYETENHSIQGLQRSIRSCIDDQEAFKLYEQRLQNLNASRQANDPSHKISALQDRANREFLSSCKQALNKRKTVLLFDTFEFVQQQEVGKWMSAEFLPKIDNATIVIVGRPGAFRQQSGKKAAMPSNVLPYELRGLELAEVRTYLQQKHGIPNLSDADIQRLWEHTDGSPLFIDMILYVDPESSSYSGNYLEALRQAERIEPLRQSDFWQRKLVAQFAELNDRNRLLFAMARCRRRFDINMLHYVVESGIWFNPGSYDDLYHKIVQLPCVKEYPELHSHLIHDETRDLLNDKLLPNIFGSTDEIREFDKLIGHYYDQIAIPAAQKEQHQELLFQLKAEYFGYLLDHANEYHAPKVGIQAYNEFMQECEAANNDYDFEELLWGELNACLDSDTFKPRAYELCDRRLKWLRTKSLFEKGVDMALNMFKRFPEYRSDIQQALGFMLMRQGKLDKAEKVFNAAKRSAAKDDFARQSSIENNLGQLMRKAGRWDEAEKHYALSIRWATRTQDFGSIAAAFSNRGYLIAQKGDYELAKTDCQRAVDFLQKAPEASKGPRELFAYMNLGSVYRHTEDFENAKEYYEKSLNTAEKLNHQEGICQALQYLGINNHLKGRRLRRNVWDSVLASDKNLLTEQATQEINQASAYQEQAWDYLTSALEIARKTGQEDAIADGANRLAKVYREIRRLEQLLERLNAERSEFKAFDVLTKKAGELYLFFRKEEYEEEQLFSADFEQIRGWLDKAAWLFELSALSAKHAHYSHREFESLMDISRIFAEQSKPNELERVIQRIQKITFDQNILQAITSILKGNLHFINKQYEQALETYKTAYMALAEQSGYASYLLKDCIRDLRWYLQELSFDKRLDWCDQLEEAWLEKAIDIKRQEMISLIERVRLKLYE